MHTDTLTLKTVLSDFKVSLLAPWTSGLYSLGDKYFPLLYTQKCNIVAVICCGIFFYVIVCIFQFSFMSQPEDKNAFMHFSGSLEENLRLSITELTLCKI